MSIEHVVSTSTLTAAIVGLMLLAAILLLMANRIKWPFTVLLVIAGLLLHTFGIDSLTGLDSFTRPEVATDIILVILLPTLIFESAFNLDASRLKFNWRAIFTLAVPGTILSTVLIGAIVGLLTPLPWSVAFLLGAILSATDPISVIALFKKLGAPKDLTLLIEGESLFNDATAIILCKLLLAGVLTGITLTDAMVPGLLSFFTIVAGGVTIGGLLGITFSWIAGRVDDDPFVEITLTLVLAYGSYLFAEFLGVSGILATVTAGLVLGGIGRPRLSTLAFRYLKNFWSYNAFIANSLIFLLVGLRGDLEMILDTGPMLLVVFAAMLVSRAVMIYSLTPLVGKISRHSRPINKAYRHLLFWGGLRGAITLALALSLESTFALGGTIIALATGAVLFTILVQGLTMGILVVRLKLDRPDSYHQRMRLGGWISAYQDARLEVKNLEETSELDRASLDDMVLGLEAAIMRFSAELEIENKNEMDVEAQWQHFLIRCLTIEVTYLQQLSENGYLSETSFIRLRTSVLQQLDALRHNYPLPVHEKLMVRAKPSKLLMRCFLGKDEYRSWYEKEEYFEAWGRAQSYKYIMDLFDEMGRTKLVPHDLILRGRELYSEWLSIVDVRLKKLQVDYPKSVHSLGIEQLKFLIINIQQQTIKREVRSGSLTEGIADSMLHELSSELMHARRGTFSLLPLRITKLLSRTQPQQDSIHHF